ncbi:efflux RND transporter periplasmic adaptor subunit [Streptomyces sp. NPDC094438]|uniref:efflux RND transporter periplasmic adaptor subunit n=1 Tax=Streptomyces sp. NPDC094438 TaxID=3366061 RepID=UPI0037F8C487
MHESQAPEEQAAPPESAATDDPTAGHARTGGRRRTFLICLAALVVITGATVAATSLTGTGTHSTGQSTGVPKATAPVTRGHISDGSQADATLGYGKERKVAAGSQGVLTKLVANGSTVSRDEALYELDGRPVRLMYGAEPVYRELKEGVKGDDARQLKANLRALGYGDGLADDQTFTSGTTAAVKRWQDHHAMKQTGTVGPADIAFAPGSVRVKAPGTGATGQGPVAVGDRVQSGGTVLTVTGTDRIVQVKMDVSAANRLKTGTKVSVELPSGTNASGSVSSIGKTVDTPSGDGKSGAGGNGTDKTPKVEVLISFDDAKKVDGIDQAPVTVRFTGETHKNVLTVPVNSLVVFSDGGFGVQVVEDGKVRDVQVKLGLFGQGRVEVSGPELRENQQVGVPKI